MAVHPDRSYTRRGQTRTLGDAVFVDLGQGKNLVALLAHVDNNLVLDDINYVALRAYAEASGKRVPFGEMSRLTGMVPVKGALIPVLIAFADPGQSRLRAGGAARRCRSGARQGLSPPGNIGRSGAERILAARFRRCAGRAGDRAESRRNCRGWAAPAIRLPRHSGRPACPGSTGSTPGRLSRENSRAAPLLLCGC